MEEISAAERNAGLYYAGPTPVVTSPSAEEALPAEYALQKANERNASSDSLEDGITAKQADTLMQWMVSKTRKTLTLYEYGEGGSFPSDDKSIQGLFGVNKSVIEMEKERNAADTILESEKSDEVILEALENRSLNGACDLGRTVTGFQAEMLGIETAYHQAIEFTSYGHAFSVHSIPIKDEAGNISKEHYLVDTTFKQFCEKETEEMYVPFKGSVDVKGWGAELTSTPEGKEIADTLLEKGYIKLTPEVAQLYLDSGIQERDRNDPDAELLPISVSNLLENTAEKEYKISEMADLKIDLLPPSLAVAGTSLDKMEAFRDRKMNQFNACETPSVESVTPQKIEDVALATPSLQSELCQPSPSFAERIIRTGSSELKR